MGKIEVRALEEFSVAYILKEIITHRFDHITARQEELVMRITRGPIFLILNQNCFNCSFENYDF